MAENKGRTNATEHLNLARWKRGSDEFELVVDADKAMEWRRTKQGDVRDVLVMPKVFSDAKKGMIASQHRLEALFGTTDELEVAKRILSEGEVQLTTEFKQKLLEQKRKQLVLLLHKQGVDPQTHAPHPITRIESALLEAKVRIDEFKPAEQQVQNALKQLRPILAIALETKDIAIVLPAEHASKAVTALKTMTKILKETWQPDGSWSGTIQIPGGLVQELYDKLNQLTHGKMEATVVHVSHE